MKKILLLTLLTFSLTGCETMNGFQSSMNTGFSNVGDWFSSEQSIANNYCPKFKVAEELDTYYEIPASFNKNETVGFSSANITNLSGVCNYNKQNRAITATLNIDFTAEPGPFTKQKVGKNLITTPYFVAVLDDKQEILAKNTFTIPFEFNDDLFAVTHHEQVQQSIPFKKGVDTSTYTIMTGFQLNETQLSYAKNQDNLANIMPAAGIDPNVMADPFAGTIEQ